MEAKVISRGTGRSAVAAAAYISCSRIYNDYDGVQHDYTRKQGLVWQEIFLPDMAPAEWADRETLWNAVEEAEKTKDSRLAREFVVALPIELGRDQWIGLLTDFIQANFVADGMCADICIHNTDDHNPHAHIMLTVRPLTKDGKWQNKTEMVMSTCFFIGHREAPDSLLPELSAEIERHITEYGVTDFVVGVYGRFDALAASCVKAAKKRHPEVTLILLLPYHPYDRPIPTPPGFDGTFYPPGMETVPKRAAIVRANRYMVDHSDYLIAYAWHSASNAWDLVEYARRREKQGRIMITLLSKL